jgi:hypothetical protein
VEEIASLWSRRRKRESARVDGSMIEFMVVIEPKELKERYSKTALL